MTKEGKAVIKPMKDQYPTKYDFQKFQNDSRTFDQANNH